MAHNSFYSVVRHDLVVPNQYQTSHKTPERCDDGDVTKNLSQSASIVPRTNTWHSQECHIGSQQHSALLELDTSVALQSNKWAKLTYKTDSAQSDRTPAMNFDHLWGEMRKSVRTDPIPIL